MIRFAIFTSYLMSMTVLFACDSAEEAKGPVIQPKKEATVGSHRESANNQGGSFLGR